MERSLLNETKEKNKLGPSEWCYFKHHRTNGHYEL